MFVTAALGRSFREPTPRDGIEKHMIASVPLVNLSGGIGAGVILQGTNISFILSLTFADDTVMYISFFARRRVTCYIFRKDIILLHLPFLHPVELL